MRKHYNSKSVVNMCWFEPAFIQFVQYTQSSSLNIWDRRNVPLTYHLPYYLFTDMCRVEHGIIFTMYWHKNFDSRIREFLLQNNFMHKGKFFH